MLVLQGGELLRHNVGGGELRLQGSDLTLNPRLRLRGYPGGTASKCSVVTLESNDLGPQYLSITLELDIVWQLAGGPWSSLVAAGGTRGRWVMVPPALQTAG